MFEANSSGHLLEFCTISFGEQTTEDGTAVLKDGADISMAGW